MSERFSFNHDKMKDNKKKEIYDRLEKVKSELEKEIDINETPDMISLKLKNQDGGERERWFMKSEKLPLNDGYVKLVDLVEASARYPHLPLAEAIKKLEKERKNNEDKKGD